MPTNQYQPPWFIVHEAASQRILPTTPHRFKIPLRLRSASSRALLAEFSKS